MIIERVKNRLGEEVGVNDEFLLEAISIIEDRLILRIGGDILPAEFNSIVVDAVVKMHRRKYFEGIKNENIDSVNTSFVDNVLEEYEEEINSYISRQRKELGLKNLVRFI